ncbi:hypothetical protein OROHE_016449 [Orobanche hederae]
MARSEAIAAVSASKPKVDDESGVCWRKEVNQNLKRLQWLLFGADTALEKGDEAFIRYIREAVSKLVSARRASIPDSDRHRLQRSDYVCWRVGGADVNANTDAVDIEGAGADFTANADAVDIERIVVDINANADAADIEFEGMRPAEYRGAGLINESSYCYVNAVFQCFVHTAEFFEHILDMHKEGISHKFLTYFLEKLADKHDKNTGEISLRDRLFCTRFVCSFKCDSCHLPIKKERRQFTRYYFYIEYEAFEKTLEQCIRRLLLDTEEYCGMCFEKSKCSGKINRGANITIFILMRRGRHERWLKYPMRLDMTPFSQDIQGALIYRLYAIVLYEPGHIYTLARIHPNKWFRYDNEKEGSRWFYEAVRGYKLQGLNQADQLVEEATAETLDEPDATNIKLCKMINHESVSSLELIREIEKRLVLNSPRIQYLALVLLETIAEHCEKALSEIAVEGVLDEIVELIDDPQTVDESTTNTLLEQLRESRVIVQRIIEAGGDNEAVLFEALDVNHEIQEVPSEYKEMKRPRVSKGGRSPP